MMSLSQGQHLRLFNKDYNVHHRILVIPTGGGIFDPTDHLISGQIRAQMDQACSQMTLELARGTDVDNLSPLIFGSQWNTNGKLMYGGNIIFLQASIVDPGQPPGIFDTVWSGRIHGVNITDTCSISCMDLGALYMNRQMRIEAPYGGPMEDVIRAILGDNGFNPDQSITIEGTPDFTIIEYMQEPVKVLEAIRLVAQQRGWDLRYFQSTGGLRCYDPDRERMIHDAVISANDYINVERLEIDDVDVRNQVLVWYAQESAAVGQVYMEDADSIQQHGPLFVQIPMRRIQQLDNLTVATRYCSLALEDMKDPLADQQVTMPYFPIVELNDFYRYVANNDHYDTDQQWAISGYTHDFSADSGITTLETRGKPMAAFRDYRRGDDEAVAMSVDDPPVLTYLDGIAFPERYLWLKTDSLSVPIA
jgi:hypothetical protein